MIPYHIGVDPGVSGAVSVIEPTEPEITQLTDMPVFKLGNRRQLNHKALWNMLADIKATLDPVECWVEEATAMSPGRIATFLLGGCFYSVLTACAGLDIPVHRVRPADWKRHFHLMNKPKEASRQRAIELLPTIADRMTRKCDHGRAEACLIALYGQQKGNAHG